MDYTQAILTINTSCIVILMVLALILLVGTRFRGENGYAAAIIVLPNVPVYLYNVSRMLGWHDFTLVVFPVSYSVNTTLLPLLWLFTRKNFEVGFRVRPRQLLHFLPGLLCLVVCLTLSVEQRRASILHEMSGKDTWVGHLNTLIILVQLFVYFTMIFRFLYKRWHAIGNTLSDAEWLQKSWIPTLMILFATLFLIVMICYAIWPRTDAWLIQILNVIAVSYLVYNSIAHPMIPVQAVVPAEETLPEPPESPLPEASLSLVDEEKMREVCERAALRLRETRAYLHPDISLALFAKEMGVSQRTLSASINGYLHYNFFEFINRMRVEEAKRCLLELETSGYNIDSVYAECGFRSRSTFFLVFKKLEGKTPAAWLREQQTGTVK